MTSADKIFFIIWAGKRFRLSSLLIAKSPLTAGAGSLSMLFYVLQVLYSPFPGLILPSRTDISLFVLAYLCLSTPPGRYRLVNPLLSVLSSPSWQIQACKSSPICVLPLRLADTTLLIRPYLCFSPPAGRYKLVCAPLSVIFFQR